MNVPESHYWPDEVMKPIGQHLMEFMPLEEGSRDAGVVASYAYHAEWQLVVSTMIDIIEEAKQPIPQDIYDALAAVDPCWVRRVTPADSPALAAESSALTGRIA